MEDDLLTISEAARVKGVTRDTVHKAVQRGALKTTTVMKPVEMVAPLDLENWQPGSYGGTERAKVRRGPGRPKRGPSRDAENAGE